jgi:hypothetical protein
MCQPILCRARNPPAVQRQRVWRLDQKQSLLNSSMRGLKDQVLGPEAESRKSNLISTRRFDESTSLQDFYQTRSMPHEIS